MSLLSPLADDSVVTQSPSTGSSARLGTHRRELVVETLHEPRQQLRRHYTYTYTSAAQGSMR